MKDIIKKLKKIQVIANSEVDNINYGGCAVMASLVATELERRKIPVEGISSFGNPSKVRNKGSDKYSAFDWESNGMGFSHVAIRFKHKERVYTYDTDKLHRTGKKFGGSPEYKCDFKFGEGLKPRELRSIAKDAGFWNSCFNREDIPKLRKIVKAVFNDKV